MTTVVEKLQALFVNPPEDSANRKCAQANGTPTRISIQLTFRKKNINKSRTRERGTEPKSSKKTSDGIVDESE